MKRMSLILLIALAMIFTISSLSAQALKPILQELYDLGGSYPDNVVYPEDGTIEYMVWVTARPGDIQYGPTGANSAGMDSGRFLLQFNMGNFNEAWTAGEILRIEVTQTTTGNIGVTEFPIIAGTSPQAMFDADAMVLILPPAVLFDSNDPAEYVVNNFNNTLVPGYPQWEGRSSYVYRAINWVALGTGDPGNSNWNIAFSTEGVIGNLQVTSKLRRANYFDEEEIFDQILGPRSFRTYYSIDGGVTWIQEPVVNHLLPLTGEDWYEIAVELPPAVYNQPDVRLQWRLLAAGGSTIASYPAESWGEIKDVKITGEMEEVIPTEYALTIEVVGEGTTVPAPGVYIYEEGTIVPLQAIETTVDWYFQYWMIDGMEVDTPNADVTVDGDKTVVAHFAYEPPPLIPPVVSDPIPANEAMDVPINTPIGWTISVGPEYWVPSIVQVNMWTGDMSGTPFVAILPVEPSGIYYYENHPFDFAYATDYYWQVIPVDPETRSTAPRTRAARDTRDREYPVSMFTTEDAPIVYYDLTIEVVGMGTTDPAPGTYPYEEGTVVNLLAIENTPEWYFDFWMIDGVEVETMAAMVTMTGDKTVVAHFENIPDPVFYDLTIEVVGMGTTDPAPGVHTYLEGTVVDLLAIENTPEWYFDFWMIDGVEVETMAAQVIMTGDKTVVAHFVYIPEPVFYDLTIEVVGMGTTDPAPGVHSYLEGTVVNLLAIENTPEWYFDFWMIDGVEVETMAAMVTMTGDKTVVAHFENIPDPVFYDLTIEVVGMGTTDPAPGVHTYLEGTVVDLLAIENTPEWYFDFWMIDGVEVETMAAQVIMTGDKTVVAHFVYIPEPVFYDLTIEVVGMGTTDPAPGVHSYLEGTVVNLLAIENTPEWYFDFWMIDGIEVETMAAMVTMTGDKTVVAHFEFIPEPVYYTLTVDIVGMGTVEVDGEPVALPYVFEYLAGTEVALEAFPAMDWAFLYWNVNATREQFTEPMITVMMNDDLTAIATFEYVEPPVFYTLTIEVVGMGTTDPAPGDHIYEEGSLVTLLAIANTPFWFFDFWIIDGVEFPLAEVEVEILDDVLAVAHFYFDDSEPPLPVELSSFTASVTTNMFVQLQWVTETETNLLGYHIYRGAVDQLADAMIINPGIITAENSTTTTEYNYVDEYVSAGETYYYWLQYVDYDLTSGFHGPITVTLTEEPVTPPEVFATRLQQNFPNPFNPNTIINYSLSESVDMMTLKVYNLLGQEVRTLHSGAKAAGDYQVMWDGRDEYGREMTSGMYFYRMTTPTYSKTYKMMLLK